MNDADHASVPTQPNQHASRPPSRLKALIILLVSAAVLYVGWHSAVRGWEQQRLLTCAALLKGLATTAKVYSQEVLALPASSVIETMIERKWVERRSTICPAHPGPRSNYVIVLPTAMGEGMDNRTIIAYEPKSNHGDGGNIVFADGHSNYLIGENYDRLITALGAGQSAPAKP